MTDIYVTPNIERLDAVLAYIKAHPDEHDQDVWRKKTECGTTMCFAGHAVAMFTPDAEWVHIPLQPNDFDKVTINGQMKTVAQVAADLLGLSDDDADTLFYGAATIGDVEFILDDIKEGVVR